MKPFRLTMGWPVSRGKPGKTQVIGECHALESSTGGVHELFISPVIDEPLKVAGVVCHEMAHVAAGIKAGHAKDFVKICRHVGLTSGKPTHVMPGEKLNESLQKILKTLGPYPHKAMKLVAAEKKPSPGVTLRCECGFRCSTSRKWVDEVGIPICACGMKLEED